MSNLSEAQDQQLEISSPANFRGMPAAGMVNGAATARCVRWPQISEVQEQIAAIEIDNSSNILRELVERAIALAVLILTAPVTLLIGISIRLESPGKAIFRQLRVGKGGKTFRFCKFRTLYSDAKQRFPELYRYQYLSEEVESLYFKVENDPRVTRAGRILRRTTLDELVNFWNVLTGDMSLVGPRPEIPEMLPYYRKEHLLKFCVRPGVTGLAQISGRGRLSFRQTEELDAQYVRTRCLREDVRILVRTVYLILKMDGAF